MVLRLGLESHGCGASDSELGLGLTLEEVGSWA